MKSPPPDPAVAAGSGTGTSADIKDNCQESLAFPMAFVDLGQVVLCKISMEPLLQLDFSPPMAYFLLYSVS